MGILRPIQVHDELPYEVSPDYRRMDQRNTVPMRMGWDPEIMKVVERFLAMRMGETRRPGEPGFTDIDVALARGAWCLEEDAGGPLSGAGVGGQAFYEWDGEVFPSRAVFAGPGQASQVVKQVARFLGASLAGIAPYDERWVYTHSYHPGTKEHEPIVFPFEPRSVIVMAVEMDYDAMRTASSYISSAAVGKGYGQIAITAHRVAEAVRALGYHAVPCGNDTAMSVPLAIQAGLGELSRIGILVTPEFGPRVRLCKVFTDLELEPDKPITFGVQEFCTTCMKCAEACPARVISKDREPGFETVTISNNPGVRKWFNNVDNCFKYWSAKVDCAACIAVCPYNKRDTFAHHVGLRLAQTPAKGLLRRLDGWLGNDRVFDTDRMAAYWPAGSAPSAAAGPASIPTAEPDDLAALTEASTPDEVFGLFAAKFARHPEKLAGMNAAIQFHVTGEHAGPWFLAVVDGKPEVGSGERPAASCAITIADRDLPLMVSGKMKAPMALISGRISVKGSLTELMKLKKLFA